MCNYCKGLTIGILVVVIIMLIVQIIIFSNEQKCSQTKITAEMDKSGLTLQSKTSSTFCLALIWTERGLILLLFILLILLLISTYTCSHSGISGSQIASIIPNCECNGCKECVPCLCNNCNCNGCSECKHCLCENCYCDCGENQCHDCYVEEDQIDQQMLNSANSYPTLHTEQFIKFV
jgi:hypothetical protein